MTKITEEMYGGFPSLRGKENIFEEAAKIIRHGWTEARKQMSEPQTKQQEIKQPSQEQQDQPKTSLPST